MKKPKETKFKRLSESGNVSKRYESYQIYMKRVKRYNFEKLI